MTDVPVPPLDLEAIDLLLHRAVAASKAVYLAADLGAAEDISRILKDLVTAGRDLQAALRDARQRVQELEGEMETARFVQRYGTPFDPTGAKTGVEIQSLRARLANLDAAATPGTIEARYRFLETLAAPMGYQITMAAPPEKFIAERIEKLEAALAAAAEREAAYKEMVEFARIVLTDDHSFPGKSFDWYRARQEFFRRVAALSPTPPEART